jgi:diaminopimelate epimerase
MRFSKWHALGNSYLVVERDDAGVLTPDRVRSLCDDELGIGADGVLEVLDVDNARAEVVIWNPDGSTAEMSGNGTRIAARWLADRTGSEAVSITVGDRVVPARMLDGHDVETELGGVEVGGAETLEVDGIALEVTPVSVGNPHVVVRRPRLDRTDLLRLGPLLETNRRFPERTNVQLVEPTGLHEIEALVWERGAGETSASGSSAVAVAAAAVAGGWCANPVDVRMPGGTLRVTIVAGRGILIGPAEELEQGEIEF